VEPVLCTAGESLRTGVGLKTRKLAAATIHHASTAPPRCLVFDPTPTRAEGQAKQLNEILEPNAERTEAPSRDDRAATPRVERNLARARFPPPPLFAYPSRFPPVRRGSLTAWCQRRRVRVALTRFARSRGDLLAEGCYAA